MDNKKTSFVGLVKRFILHRKFNSGGANDIALIIVSTKTRLLKIFYKLYVPFLKLKKPVPGGAMNMRRLPIIGETSDLPINTTCVISGWGAIHYRGPSSRYLKVANVTVFDLNRCKRVYGKFPQNVICAGKYEGGEDACQVRRAI